MPTLQRFLYTDTSARKKVSPQWHTREAEEADAYPQREDVERIAAEDMALIAGVIAEEVHASIARGWAPNRLIADACQAFKARKHAPHLMESDELPAE